MDTLSELAKKMGSETAFSASECAEALNYLALAGYDTQQMCDTLPTVLNLAAAGDIELAAASDMVTDAMSALGMGDCVLDRLECHQINGGYHCKYHQQHGFLRVEWNSQYGFHHCDDPLEQDHCCIQWHLQSVTPRYRIC